MQISIVFLNLLVTLVAFVPSLLVCSAGFAAMPPERRSKRTKIVGLLADHYKKTAPAFSGAKLSV